MLTALTRQAGSIRLNVNLGPAVNQLNTILIQNLEDRLFYRLRDEPVPLDAEFRDRNGLLEVIGTSPAADDWTFVEAASQGGDVTADHLPDGSRS